MDSDSGKDYPLRHSDFPEALQGLASLCHDQGKRIYPLICCQSNSDRFLETIPDLRNLPSQCSEAKLNLSFRYHRSY